MGCSCSKACFGNTDLGSDMMYDSSEKETNDIANATFIGEKHEDCYAVTISLYFESVAER